MSRTEMAAGDAQGAQAAAQRVDSTASERIRIARVIAVFFVVLVHVNPGATDQNIALHGFRAFEYVRTYIVDILAGGGLRLLCIVAGYLFVFSLAKRGYDDLIARKFRSLIVPLLSWNTLYFCVLAVGGLISSAYWQQKFSGLSLNDWLNTFFPFTKQSINAPVSFFRDMFVCMLLAPALLPLVRMRPAILLGVLTVLVFSPWTFGVLLLRFDILLFFTLGITLATYRPPLDALDRYFWIVVPAVAVLGLFDVLAYEGFIVEGTPIPIYFARADIAAVLLIWWLAAIVRPHPIGRYIQSWEPYVFVVFCGHIIFSTFFWIPWKLAFGGYYAPLYPAFYFVAPFLCFAAAYVFVEIGRRTAPRVLDWFTGGRDN